MGGKIAMSSHQYAQNLYALKELTSHFDFPDSPFHSAGILKDGFASVEQTCEILKNSILNLNKNTIRLLFKNSNAENLLQLYINSRNINDAINHEYKTFCNSIFRNRIQFLFDTLLLSEEDLELFFYNPVKIKNFRSIYCLPNVSNKQYYQIQKDILEESKDHYYKDVIFDTNLIVNNADLDGYSILCRKLDKLRKIFQQAHPKFGNWTILSHQNSRINLGFKVDSAVSTVFTLVVTLVLWDANERYSLTQKGFDFIDSVSGQFEGDINKIVADSLKEKIEAKEKAAEEIIKGALGTSDMEVINSIIGEIRFLMNDLEVNVSTSIPDGKLLELNSDLDLRSFKLDCTSELQLGEPVKLLVEENPS